MNPQQFTRPTNGPAPGNIRPPNPGGIPRPPASSGNLLFRNPGPPPRLPTGPQVGPPSSAPSAMRPATGTPSPLGPPSGPPSAMRPATGNPSPVGPPSGPPSALGPPNGVPSSVGPPSGPTSSMRPPLGPTPPPQAQNGQLRPPAPPMSSAGLQPPPSSSQSSAKTPPPVMPTSYANAPRAQNYTMSPQGPPLQTSTPSYRPSNYPQAHTSDATRYPAPPPTSSMMRPSHPGSQPPPSSGSQFPPRPPQFNGPQTFSNGPQQQREEQQPMLPPQQQQRGYGYQQPSSVYQPPAAPPSASGTQPPAPRPMGGKYPIPATAAASAPPTSQSINANGPSLIPGSLPNGPQRPQGPPPTGPYMRPPGPQGVPPHQQQTLQGNIPNGPQGYYQGPPGPQQPQQGFPAGQQQHFQNGAIQNMFGERAYSGVEPVDLLQNRHILPSKALPTPKPRLQADTWNKVNCSPDIFRCTLTKIPETEGILKKSRLPFGILIHPFRDLSHLPVIQCNTIVRCRQCRTYINPFVHFVDQRRWRCNVCYRVNELPEEFLYDPVSKTYGDPSRRPECKSATIEFIAPSEYMLRPPQPAVYIFCLDVSHAALETGYLKTFCDILLEELDKIPGDGRTQIGFITYDRFVHFYEMPEGASQPNQLNVVDVDDVFLPTPTDLLVNLHDCRNLVESLLRELPKTYKNNNHTQSALGAALQAAYKMASPTGGRITVVQTTLPTIGPGSVGQREVVSGNPGKNDSALLGPANDFYKKLALDCSGQQVAVDLFTLNSQFVDLATLSGISKFSGGQIQHFPNFHVSHNTAEAAKFESALRRYLTRKIGFEAVMRIRCTRGLSPHTFHGNFFVRSTDLLSLPNINPDAGFAMQVAIEDELQDSREVSFQAALLYTSSKGERRIRVHTLCIPTTSSVPDVINGADQQAVVGMLAKFAAERAINNSVNDAKEGLVVSNIDAIETFKTYSSMGRPNGLLISPSLMLLPLYTLATMRAIGFRNAQRLDDRSFCFCQFKCLPLNQLIQYIYPDLYRVDELTEEGGLEEVVENDEDEDENNTEKIIIPQPSRIPLSYEQISATGMYLMDRGDTIYLYLCRGLHQFVLERIFGVTKLHSVDESITELPELDNPQSEMLRTFIHWLNGSKPYVAPIRVIREDSKARHLFTERLVEDRMDNSFSYFEFLQHLKQQIKK